MEAPIHILIMERQRLTAESLQRALQSLDPRFKVVGIAKTGVEAARVTAAHRPQVVLVDSELAQAMRELLDTPGRRLFSYRLEDEIYNLSARRLNEYIAEFMGEEFTTKDFRTWGGTLIAAVALAERPPVETETEVKRTIAAVMRTVGERLGNTPAVARASYVSPAVVEQYLDGRTIDDFRPRHLRVVRARETGLNPEEQALVSLLRSWRIRRARKAA